MKRFILLFTTLFLSMSVFANKYQITKVEYDITGMTKQFALEQRVPVDKTIVFQSEEELSAYVEGLKQALMNQRNFESAEIEYEIYALVDISDDQVKEVNVEDDITEITLHITTVDSKHLLILPYPKYSSSSGFSIKLKAKDTNFLGTLSEFNADAYVAFLSSGESDQINYQFGFDLDYDMPFKLGPLDGKWINDYEFSYTIGQTSPEFYAETGVDFTLPFEKLSLNFQALQRIGKELDYEVYGDSLYFGNQLTFSLPVTVYETMDYTKLYLIPFADFTINYDYNGISQSNYNLSSPVIKTGVQFKANDINWLGNFREGWYADVSAYYGYNFQQQASVPGASFNMQAFKAFNRFALAGRLYGFIQSEKSPYYKVGEYLRGIRDETRFAPGTGNEEEIALNVESVILLNMDFPVKLFTWDWTKFTDSHFWSNLNFDVQLSPFIDMALTSNPASGRNFHPADGYYSAGFEVLVYPEKWKGIVVRGSLGFDLGDLFLSKTNFYESSWRRDVSAYEIYIGIGLHY